MNRLSPSLVNQVALAIAAISGVVGCAHSAGRGAQVPPPEERIVLAVDESRGREPVEQPVVVTVDPPSETRPRLSRTVTLGQGTVEAYAPTPQRAPAPSTQGQGVTVQNNIYVYGGQPTYGYGYGSYGSYGSRSFGSRTENFGRSGGSRAWGTTGWEGAGRTAAPGRTPGVGGNWAAPASHGPAPMR